jgi:hypothetical protein
MEPATVLQKLQQLRRELGLAVRPPAREPRRKRRQAPRSVSRAKRVAPTNAWLTPAVALLKALFVIVLPFYVYVRSSVYFYAHGVAPWLAIGLGAILTMAIVAAYATWISRRFSGRARAASMARWIALPVAAAWCAYAVVYLARVNAKTDGVRSYYGSVHPVLRAALGTAILVDPDIVMTDALRLPADYARMGLPVYDRTLHYRQKSGWVHAVDLRTRDRSAVKNFAVQLYFSSMGFRTLRHVGTADHLHVSLPVRD